MSKVEYWSSSEEKKHRRCKKDDKKDDKKDKKDRTSRAFWSIPEIGGYLFPVDILPKGYRAVNVPTLKLFESKDFEEKLIVPGEPALPYKVLLYTGNKKKTFKVDTLATFFNNGDADILIKFALAKGKNGQVPTEIITNIKDEKFAKVGDYKTGVSNGLITLEPQDTLTIFFNNDITIPANTMNALNVNVVLHSI